MQSMLGGNIVSKDKSRDFVHMVCQMWDEHTLDARDSLMTARSLPDKSDMVHILSHTDPDKDEEVEALDDVCRRTTDKQAADYCVGVTQELLEQSQRGTEEEPDLILRRWVEALNEKRDRVLLRVIESGNLSDGRMLRVWEIVLDDPAEQSTSFYRSVLPMVFGEDEYEKTQKVILEDKKNISSRFSTADDRYELGKALLTAFIQSNSKQTKNQLCEWIRDIQAKGALDELSKQETISDDNLDILKDHFPNNSSVTQADKESTSGN